MDELIIAFSLGNAAILTNACLLPLYPGLIAFLAGNAQHSRARHTTALMGVLVLAGILTMMLLIGAGLSLLSVSFPSILPVILPVIYVLVIVMGLVMLLGKNPFATLQTAQAPILKNSYLTAYVYGLLFGPMTLPCTGPIIISAFTIGSGVGDVANGLLFFLFFGLGFGWPLVVLPLLAASFQRRIVSVLAHHHHVLTRAAGVLLIAVGIFGILTELIPQISATFYLEQSHQLIYWAVTALVTFAVGYMTYRHDQQSAEMG